VHVGGHGSDEPDLRGGVGEDPDHAGTSFDLLVDPLERRYNDGDARYPNYRTPIPELVMLADLLEAEFTGPIPWEEDLRDPNRGDFLDLTMSCAEGATVEAFIARNAPVLSLVVYSPISSGLHDGVVNHPKPDVLAGV